jgi:hypothetical protein
LLQLILKQILLQLRLLAPSGSVQLERQLLFLLQLVLKQVLLQLQLLAPSGSVQLERQL